METLLYLKSIISHDLELLHEEKEGIHVKVGGIIEQAKKIITKKSNSEMAFVTLANEKGIKIECVVFPRIFAEYKHLLLDDTVVVIEGRLDTKNDKPAIIADRIVSIEHVPVSYTHIRAHETD